MIRINLLSTKPSKKIPLGSIVPYFFVLLVAAGCAAGWFLGSEALSTYNDGVNAEIKKLTQEKASKEQKVKDRDRARQAYNRLNSEVNRLQRLSGANYLQWSTTMDTIKDVVPKDKVWITNLRIDSDRRVQITAYSSNKGDDKGPQKEASEANLTEGIRLFIKDLINNKYFSDVFLTGATKNMYEKKPVWRFELNCRLLRDLASKSED